MLFIKAFFVALLCLAEYFPKRESLFSLFSMLFLLQALGAI